MAWLGKGAAGYCGLRVLRVKEECEKRQRDQADQGEQGAQRATGPPSEPVPSVGVRGDGDRIQRVTGIGQIMMRILHMQGAAHLDGIP